MMGLGKKKKRIKELEKTQEELYETISSKNDEIRELEIQLALLRDTRKLWEAVDSAMVTLQEAIALLPDDEIPYEGVYAKSKE